MIITFFVHGSPLYCQDGLAKLTVLLRYVPEFLSNDVHFKISVINAMFYVDCMQLISPFMACHSNEHSATAQSHNTVLRTILIDNNVFSRRATQWSNHFPI